MTFAERYWDLYNRRYDTEASELLLFDVKSTVAECAGDQVYLTSIGQRRHVAFYLCVNGADPTFVEIIPNYHQDAKALEAADPLSMHGGEASREVAVNVTRVSRLPPSAYGGIDQCSSPYRIPITMLPQAIALVRAAVRGKGTFSNPWTAVPFPHWQPKTTFAVDFLRPSDDSHHASAYEAVLELYRVLKYDERSSLDVDFMRLQPSLADFKLWYQSRQYFVQHKLNNVLRAADTPLTRVPIARDGGYYFTAFQRYAKQQPARYVSGLTSSLASTSCGTNS